MNVISPTIILLRRYSQERSPLMVISLIAIVLFGAGIQTASVTIGLFLKGWLSMAIFLFLIRLSDDLCDLPSDRITHPGRVLCSDDINLNQVNLARATLAIFLLALQLPNMQALMFLAVSLAICVLFFQVKPKLPTLVHVGLLNSTLFIFPVYCALLLFETVGLGQLIFGLFFWSGGFAHDLAHSLVDEEKTKPEQIRAINRINQRFLAVLSLVLFITASGFGFLLYRIQYAGGLFLFVLIVCLLIILYLETQLIKHPDKSTARPFYVRGFLFFLLPALGHLIAVTIL